MARIIKIAVDGTVTEQDIKTFRYPHLNELFGEDRFIERVKSARLQDRFGRSQVGDAHRVVPVMVVDESGRIDGLPINDMATRLYAPYPERHRYFIAGDAYIVGEGMTMEGPDFVGLPDEVTVEMIRQILDMFSDH